MAKAWRKVEMGHPVMILGLVSLWMLGAGGEAVLQGWKTSKCGAIVAAYAIVAALSLGSLWSRDDRDVLAGKPGIGRKRVALVDNCKVMVNVFLIFTHWCYYNLDQSTHLPLSDSQTWLNGDAREPLLMALRLSNWAVPLACVCSGLVSQKPQTWRRWLETTVVPVLMWERVAKPVIYDWLFENPADLSLLGTRLLELVFGQTYHREWFLEALIAWRCFAMVPMGRGTRLAAAWALSLAAGYRDIPDFLGIPWNPVLGYAPYFAVGLALPSPERLVAFVQARRCRVLPFACGLALVSLALERHLEPLPDNHGAYSQLWASSEYLGLPPSAQSLYWIRRLAKHCIDLAQCAVVVFVVVPTREAPWTHRGAKILCSFCAHEIALKWLDRVVPPLAPVVTSSLGHAAVVAAHLPYSFCIMQLLTSKPVCAACDVFLKPTWLTSRFVGDDAASQAKSHAMCASCDGFFNPTCFASRLATREPVLPTRGSPRTTVESPRQERREEALCDPEFFGAKLSLESESLPSVEEGSEALADVLLETKDARGSATLHGMAAGHKFMPWLLWPFVFQLAATAFAYTVVCPALADATLATQTAWEAVPTLYKYWLFASMVVLPMLCIAVSDAVVLVKLRRGLEPPRLLGPPCGRELTHAVVICQYKEPYAILEATIASLATQSRARDLIVVLACEARDPEADETFAALKLALGGNFRLFLKTEHVLRPGLEVAGKSSNENYAVRCLYAHVVSEGIDPYSLMVTIADADSLFDRYFIDHLEAEFRRSPNGERAIFDAPIHVTRNLPECEALIGHFEIARTQFETFGRWSRFNFAQSNYSLTLGFARELGFWDPMNTSEDMHTTLKALALTSCADVTVPVWSVVLNDAVSGYSSRWEQAKRHMWGVEELAWLIAQFPNLRLRTWSSVFFLALARFASTTCPAWLIVVFPAPRRVFAALKPETRQLCLSLVLAFFLFGWIRFFALEFAYRAILFARREPGHLVPLPKWRWAVLVLLYPIHLFLAPFIFNTCATWRMLVHAQFSPTLRYVTAPKSSTSWANLRLPLASV
mmetsp:Transcript_23231/g.72774  ORF Transcript_23231/g.72774 Transcript_23231/m.72774 type:complete len:1052 (+) Transcript_23231:83-3238(+)